MTEQLIQGSPEWLAARCGSLGASQVADAMAKTKSGYGASRKNLVFQLAIERITGEPEEMYVNGAMQRGTEMEPHARNLYSFVYNVDVAEVGMVRHPTIKGTHASPDGLIGADGCCEIKCPNKSTHGEYLIAGKAPSKYIPQMQWVMACTGRRWCDFVSFDDRFPAHLQLFAIRVNRDEELIKTMEAEIITFLAEVDDVVSRLMKLEQAA